VDRPAASPEVCWDVLCRPEEWADLLTVMRITPQRQLRDDAD